MAKVPFTKLGLKSNNTIRSFVFNEQTIEVKQYLSIEEKLQLITNVLEKSHDENNFSNPIKVDVYTALEILDKYTNISFTEKQKENLTKLYDLLINSGLLKSVIDTIPEEEYHILIQGIDKTITSVYKYQNSILGILESISQDYSNLNFDIDMIKNKLTNPEQISTLKELAQVSGFYNNDVIN